MTLQIQQREADGVVILALKGSLVLGEQDAKLRECLRSLFDAGKVRIVLNLRETGKVDSTGLGTLLAARVKLRGAGGGLALCDLIPSHLELIVMTKLHTAFEIFADEHNAVNSFFPDRATKVYDVLTFVREQEAERLAGHADEPLWAGP